MEEETKTEENPTEENKMILIPSADELEKIKSVGKPAFVYNVPIPTMYSKYVFKPISYAEYLAVLEQIKKLMRAHQARIDEQKEFNQFDDREAAKFLTVDYALLWPKNKDPHLFPDGDIATLYSLIMLHSGHFSLDVAMANTEAL